MCDHIFSCINFMYKSLTLMLVYSFVLGNFADKGKIPITGLKSFEWSCDSFLGGCQRRPHELSIFVHRSVITCEGICYTYRNTCVGAWPWDVATSACEWGKKKKIAIDASTDGVHTEEKPISKRSVPVKGSAPKFGILSDEPGTYRAPPYIIISLKNK